MSPLRLKSINNPGRAASIANFGFNCPMVTLCADFTSTSPRATTTPREFRRFQIWSFL